MSDRYAVRVCAIHHRKLFSLAGSERIVKFQNLDRIHEVFDSIEDATIAALSAISRRRPDPLNGVNDTWTEYGFSVHRLEGHKLAEAVLLVSTAGELVLGDAI